MLYLQSNPAMPEYVYIGKPIIYDPETMPEPYVVMAEVAEDVLGSFEPYRDPGARDGFYKINIEDAMKIVGGRR